MEQILETVELLSRARLTLHHAYVDCHVAAESWQRIDEELHNVCATLIDHLHTMTERTK